MMVSIFALSIVCGSKLNPASLYDSIVTRFRIEKTEFLAESIGGDSNPNQPMFNWGIGVTLSAENALTRLDPSRKPRLVKTLEMCEKYWNPTGPVGGFDVVPGPPFPKDRYYDDNAWMVLAYVESYEILGDKKWLVRAQEALRYVLSGEDEKLGGGIYWRESDKASKNTCSNGPSATACLAVYRHTRSTQLLTSAQRLYDWTKLKLLDTSDGLYFDNLALDGKVEKTKWSYNSALMLRTARELHALTQNQEYERDAEALEAASIKRWVKADGTIDDELQFSHLLFENLSPARFDAQKCIDRLMSAGYKNGLFGHRWGQAPGVKNGMIIQASAIRALAVHQLRSGK